MLREEFDEKIINQVQSRQKKTNGETPIIMGLSIVQLQNPLFWIYFSLGNTSKSPNIIVQVRKWCKNNKSVSKVIENVIQKFQVLTKNACLFLTVT